MRYEENDDNHLCIYFFEDKISRRSRGEFPDEAFRINMEAPEEAELKGLFGLHINILIL
ncbi:MAG TPA: hypothetical protein VGK25_02390 [Ignavibacteria bacterium]